MDFVERILSYCSNLGMSQSSFEKASGLSKGLISKWKRGIRPGLSSRMKVAHFMHLGLEELISERDELSFYSIPLIDPSGSAPDDIRSDHINILPEYVSDPAECFAAVVADESMKPKMQQGDVVIVDKSASPVSGDIAAVTAPGFPLICRKILLDESGIIFLPLNTEYDATYIRLSDMEALHITVSGRIVSQIHFY